MRPTATSPSVLEEPLNGLLGTETNVRILRVLARTSTALGKSEVARRAQLNDSGVRRALDRLVRFGIVEAASAGVQTVRLRRDHYLTEILVSLFEAERESYRRIVDALRRVSGAVSPPPMSAWVMGLADYDDETGSLVLGVVVEASRARRASRQLAEGVERQMREFDLRIDPRVLTLADVAAGEGPDPDSDVVLLVGPHPADLAIPGASAADAGTPARDHARLDRRQLRFASALADRLLDDPELIDRTIRQLRTEVAADTPWTDPRREWLDILERESASAVRRLLLDPGETATRLRQSLPFTAVLTQAERERLRREAWNDEE